MILSAGTRLGPYEIVSLIGEGGMGEVYRARDTRLDRDVAVKVLPNSLAADPEARARFEREARAVSQLNHPHICALYDVGQSNDVEFLVMEYLEGESLAARLTRGPLARFGSVHPWTSWRSRSRAPTGRCESSWPVRRTNTRESSRQKANGFPT